MKNLILRSNKGEVEKFLSNNITFSPPLGVFIMMFQSSNGLLVSKKIGVTMKPITLYEAILRLSYTTNYDTTINIIYTLKYILEDNYFKFRNSSGELSGRR